MKVDEIAKYDQKYLQNCRKKTILNENTQVIELSLGTY